MRMSSSQILTEKDGRHFLLMIDGSGVSASQTLAKERVSNIYKLNLCVQTRSCSGNAQVTFYEPGIGSQTTASSNIDKLAELALGLGLKRFVEVAYLNLSSNFNGVDKVYIFGFSRGAVIARLLAALISKFGVLKPSQAEYFHEIWDYFVNEKMIDEDVITENFFNGVKIEFLGLFDTVYGEGPFNIGWLSGKDYNNVKNRFDETRVLPKNVKVAVHILALDETRSSFQPVLFNEVNHDNDQIEQCLEQIWMPGVHADVGGGYRASFLSRVALITMLDRLKKHTDIALNEDMIDDLRNSIKERLRNTDSIDTDSIVIGDEFEDWPWRIFRTIQKITGFVKSQVLNNIVKHWYTAREPDAHSKFQFYHPVCKRIEGHFIVWKWKKEFTTYTMMQERPQLPYAVIKLFDNLFD